LEGKRPKTPAGSGISSQIATFYPILARKKTSKKFEKMLFSWNFYHH